MKYLAKIELIFKIALRNVLRQKRRSLVVASTAAVGIICVAVSQSFINGMYNSMVTLTVETGLGHAQIRPKGYLDSRQTGLRLKSARDMEKKFASALPPHTHYAPRMEREAILRFGSEVKGVLLFGIEPDLEPKVSQFHSWMVRGQFLQPLSSAPATIATPCLIGTKNAEDQELDTGDLMLISTGGTDGGSRSFRCLITGVFRSPSAQLDRSIVLMLRSELARIRNDGPSDEISYFVFHGRSIDESESIKTSLTAALPDHSGIEIASIAEIEPALIGLFEMYDQLTIVMYFLLLFGFGVVLFESVTMSIFERMREIGIIHALGTRPRFLFLMVLVESLLLTLLGVLMGLLIGYIVVFAMGVNGVNFEEFSMGIQTWGGSAGTIYPYLTFGDFVDSVWIAGLISFISGLYPAWRAAHAKPLQAIYNR